LCDRLIYNTPTTYYSPKKVSYFFLNSRGKVIFCCFCRNRSASKSRPLEACASSQLLQPVNVNREPGGRFADTPGVQAALCSFNCASHVHDAACECGSESTDICDVGGLYVRFGGASDRPMYLVGCGGAQVPPHTPTASHKHRSQCAVGVQNRSQEDARTVMLCPLYDDLTDHDVRVVVVTYRHVLGGCWCL
jgi:hypothetical protein